MDVTRFDIQGPLLIKLRCWADRRGFFVERFASNKMADLGLPTFVQDNFSRSLPGVVRGLHYQWHEPQSKLVTVLSGEILDVAVDIRSRSPTFGETLSIRLSGDQPAWLWIPAGFAHGFQALGNGNADVMYKVDVPYNPAGEQGILWNDSDLSITWPGVNPILSDKDVTHQSWADYKRAPHF